MKGGTMKVRAFNDAVVRPISPMKHADFEFGLTYPKSNAHTWPTRAEAEAFASGIRESAVESYYAWHGLVWVTRVGPWMYAYQVRQNSLLGRNGG